VVFGWAMILVCTIVWVVVFRWARESWFAILIGVFV
jgi:hypothetical protein